MWWQLRSHTKTLWTMNQSYNSYKGFGSPSTVYRPLLSQAHSSQNHRLAPRRCWDRSPLFPHSWSHHQQVERCHDACRWVMLWYIKMNCSLTKRTYYNCNTWTAVIDCSRFSNINSVSCHALFLCWTSWNSYHFMCTYWHYKSTLSLNFQQRVAGG